MTNGIGGETKISQGTADPGSTVVKSERVKVSDRSKGYDDLGNPNQSDATKVTTQDGSVTTITDDGRVIQKMRPACGTYISL